MLALILLREPSLNTFPQAIVYDDRVSLYWLRWTEKPFSEVAKFDQFKVGNKRSAAYDKKINHFSLYFAPQTISKYIPASHRIR